MLLLDAGTSYAKILEDGRLRILRTEELPPGFRADSACGHGAARFSDNVVNELVALARGGAAMIGEESFVLLDVGARDMKSVRLEEGKLVSCNWNDSCGALCGFTVEVLSRHFGFDWAEVKPVKKGIHVTCGIFALSELLDSLSSGAGARESAAGIIRGMAEMTHAFAGFPDRFHLSGGLCENSAYLGSFDCEVVPLGRAVTLEGLKLLSSADRK